MSNKHTPGPWYVTGSEAGGAMIVNTDTIIARWPENGPSRSQVPNARLIAAAPELLEALQAIATHDGRDPGQHEPSSAIMRRIARAAITKAVQS